MHVMTSMVQEVLGGAFVFKHFLAVISSKEKIDEFLNEPANRMAAVFQFKLQVRFCRLLPLPQ